LFLRFKIVIFQTAARTQSVRMRGQRMLTTTSGWNSALDA